MRFLVDAQLPPALAGWLGERGFAARCLTLPGAPPVVWLRIGNCTNRALFAWLEPLHAGIIERLDSGNRLVEVRRERSKP